MFKRLLALVALAFLPAGTALALTSAPVPTAPVTVTGALFDKLVKTNTPNNINKAQGIQGYNVTVHDDNYEYSLPLCANSSLVEVNGNLVDPNSFISGDTVVVSVQPNPAADAKACISRIVRQAIARGASSGECLQNYQVKEEIAGSPAPLLLDQEYTYLLRVYARPTLDCDGKAYGASPITTVVAAAKPFKVALTRGDNPTELMSWSLTTDTSGRASFAYTFKDPGSDYKFQISPGGDGSPGDQISWSAKVLDPDPSPSPSPAAASSNPPSLSIWPVVVVLAMVLGVGVGMELRHRMLKAREHESPEDEYRRVNRF